MCLPDYYRLIKLTTHLRLYAPHLVKPRKQSFWFVSLFLLKYVRDSLKISSSPFEKLADVLSIIHIISGIAQSFIRHKRPVLKGIFSSSVVVYKSNILISQENIAQSSIYQALIWNAFKFINKAPVITNILKKKDSLITTMNYSKQIFTRLIEKCLTYMGLKHYFIINYSTFLVYY